MRFKIVLFLFLFCPLLLKGQETEEKEKFNPSPILKFSFLSLLLDPLPSLQFAVEHKIARRHSLQHELGYVAPLLHGNSYNSSTGKNLNGIRIRNEYRYYITPDESGLGGFYCAPEILLIFLSYQKTGTFGQRCEEPFDCAYFERKDYEVRKQVYAFHPKIGYQWVSRRFVIELYGGLGIRKVRIQHLDNPGFRGWNEDGYNWFDKGEGKYDLPSMSFGMKIGFLLKKRDEEVFPYYRENH